MGNRCSVTYEETVEANKATTKALKDPMYVCRDDLKEGFPAPASASSATHHGREERKRRRKEVVGSSGRVTRVKLLLTKKEAALLLAKCEVEEGQLKFKLSDRHLQKIRTNPSRTSPDRRSWNPALQSISEEF